MYNSNLLLPKVVIDDSFPQVEGLATGVVAARNRSGPTALSKELGLTLARLVRSVSGCKIPSAISIIPRRRSALRWCCTSAARYRCNRLRISCSSAGSTSAVRGNAGVKPMVDGSTTEPRILISRFEDGKARWRASVTSRPCRRSLPPTRRSTTTSTTTVT